MSTLYYIDNIGCDDDTQGLAEIPDEFFPLFKEIIENLNKNSYYGCMPTIEVYKVTADDKFLKKEKIDDAGNHDDLHFKGEIYTFNKNYIRYNKLERVI